MSPALERRNPTVKLAVLFACSLATLFILNPLTLGLLTVLAIIAVLTTTRLTPGRLLAASVPFVAFGVGLVMVNALSRPGGEILEGLPVRVTSEGLAIGFALALRTTVIGMLSIAFIASTPPRDLMTSLTQHARLSPRFAYALLAGFRLLQLLPSEWQSIRAAQAVRASLGRDGTPRTGITAFGAAAFSLLVVSIRSGERIAQALESRGLGAGPRTVWRPVALDARDATLAIVVLCAFALAATLGIAAGTGLSLV
ncbi:energy-coupling factor transporter transmembrane component T family protein [Pseudoclavibacter sp. VKM Ac-2888]|uniref:energy-coupling factor transporter transmembrane component T family protein n=1 Tax=Pseudoclavibacter sp. VKM Ac-2888 TaxID=2783830 RepID=UPI00188B7E70|nr:energy-coupling factor transporter transmembrane component T [Pseudoclavibacter sp. VKM Ac-2888]MBF4550214.1 energy-coupling factor transporter transmembrane protein EcfT [Pseudoclavibacter sp. VKM Ac-2888]